MPKVSVIVPVYNAEKYLHECIESILNQTVKDIELILVDDGSIDSSPTICDIYATRDSRVKVIHKSNGRASSARNAGIHAATGEYVAFVDSDDWISSDMYEKMLEVQVDVCLCDYVRFIDNREVAFTQPNIRAGFYNKKQICKEIYPHLVMDGVEFPITISNWVLLIKRRIIIDNNLLYREDIHVSEDSPFGSEVLYYANSFIYLKGTQLYHYRVTEESTSRVYKTWWWDSSLKINEEIESFFSKCSEFDFTQQIKANMFYLARAEIYYILNNKQLTRKEQNKQIKEVMNHPRVIRMMQGYNTTGIALSFKFIYWSIRCRSIVMRRLVGIASDLKAKVRG